MSHLCYNLYQEKEKLQWLSSNHFEEGNGTPLQSSCLENPMDGGAWWVAVHRIAKSQTRLSDFPFTFHFHALEKEMATCSSVPAWRIPGTGRACWTAVYGIAQSWTRLKRLSSSSSTLLLWRCPLPMRQLGYRDVKWLFSDHITSLQTPSHPITAYSAWLLRNSPLVLWLWCPKYDL